MQGYGYQIGGDFSRREMLDSFEYSSVCAGENEN